MMFCRESLIKAPLIAGILALLLPSATFAHSEAAKRSTNYLDGGDFTLQAATGPVSLSDLRGKVVLIFFGYTSCPDVCPLTLARVNACFSTLKDEELAGVRALFITLDPERDTSEVLEKYTRFFHPNIIGLRDGAEGIDTVTKKFGVQYSKKIVPNSALGYSISHSTDILLLDRQGRFVKAVPHNTDVSQLRAEIRSLFNATH